MSQQSRSRNSEPAVCSQCKGALKPAAGARAAYVAMIARFRVLGYPQCPVCRDYVLTLAGHACPHASQVATLPQAA